MPGWDRRDLRGETRHPNPKRSKFSMDITDTRGIMLTSKSPETLRSRSFPSGIVDCKSLRRLVEERLGLIAGHGGFQTKQLQNKETSLLSRRRCKEWDIRN